ncbi:MAG: hypothetical protein P8N52_06730 [Crocinitomicaceae bacterium]|nr:hypothetical protein [Crocinitomicaceae bacterium]MDG1777353.1 hypothetical protein [Crocinitomicaceae bacterium]
MKKSIEQGIKNSLENHEVPYNGDAWTAMQKKLDAKKPTQPNFKGYAAVLAILAVVITSFIVVERLTDKPTQKTQNIKTNENNEPNSIKLKEVIQKNSIEAHSTQNKVIETSNIGNATLPQNKTKVSVEASQISQLPQEVIKPLLIEETPINPPRTIRETAVPKIIVLPIVSDVCEGEVIQIENQNDEAILIENNSLRFIIPANTKRSIRTKATGNYSISLLNTTENSKVNTFFVKANPAVDFTIDSDTKFEEGIPSTHIECLVPGHDFSWAYTSQTSKGRKTTAHFYNKGDHDVTLTVTGSNGCTASLTKSVYIDQTYNLMAVNSFMPTSTDTRKSTFMPYALTQRNNQFTLIVIDPIDGHIVYQTSDASAGWDGVDKSTGRLVSFKSAYIWKVIMETTEPHEKNEYLGNIIPVAW